MPAPFAAVFGWPTPVPPMVTLVNVVTDAVGLPVPTLAKAPPLFVAILPVIEPPLIVRGLAGVAVFPPLSTPAPSLDVFPLIVEVDKLAP